MRLPAPPVKIALALAFSALAIAGCRSGPAASAESAASPDDETDWFCQEAGDSGEWECIQDDALARDPEKARQDNRLGQSG